MIDCLLFISYSILVLVKIWETGSYSSNSSTVIKIISNFAQSRIAYVHVFPHPFNWDNIYLHTLKDFIKIINICKAQY